MFGCFFKCYFSILCFFDLFDISIKLKVEIFLVEKFLDRFCFCGVSRVGIGIDEVSERERVSFEDVI